MRILKICFCAMTLLGIQAQLFSNDFQINDKSYNNLHCDEFTKQTSQFLESPSYFTGNWNIPKDIAFEDSMIHLTPGDIIKLSEDLTYSYKGQAIAEEDFVLKDKNAPQVEDDEKPKAKGIQF